MNKKRLLIIITILILLMIMLWFCGIIPKQTGKKQDTDYSSNNTTEPYIPEGLNVVNGNEIEIPAESIEYNRDPKNVTIEVIEETISNTSVEILITDNNEDHYGWGVQFRVQEKVNEEWKDLKYISDDVSWIAIGYLISEGNQLTLKVNIEEYYGKLDKGIYRIVKPVYDNGYVDIYSNEFEIK